MKFTEQYKHDVRVIVEDEMKHPYTHSLGEDVIRLLEEVDRLDAKIDRIIKAFQNVSKERDVYRNAVSGLKDAIDYMNNEW